MKVKNFLFVLLSVLLCFTFTACGDKPQEKVNVDNIPKYDGEQVDITTKDVYQNAMNIENQWENYGIGDPYIMKYNGLFYLYVSSPYGKTGIKVWTSKNAIDWKYAAIIGEDRNSTYTAYSPKVMYDNGTFYLYTTPDGNGLHILTAPTALGPFTDISGVQHPIERVNGALVPCNCKVHSSIDACIFIDDDGQWYLGHGNSLNGIEYHKMTSPTQIAAEAFYPGAVIEGNAGNNWTETGEIFKRDDTYFMTFSGNHVANDSYRTNWASGKKPLDGYTAGDMPLLTSTYGNQKGVGCGLVFQGADLVNDYVVYHNLINPKIGPIRGLNIDRVSYNGGELNAFGPTSFIQEKPQMPTAHDDLTTGDGFTPQLTVSGGFGAAAASTTILYNTAAKKEYAAELNFNPLGGEASVYFSYIDENNYGRLSVDVSGKLTLTTVKGGAENTFSAQLGNYNASALHSVKVKKAQGKISVYIDGMRKFNESDTLSAGKLGYSFSAGGKIGFTALTDISDSSEAGAYYKSAEGKIFAKDYVAAHSATDLTLTDGNREGKAVTLKKDAFARYNINGGEETDFVMNLTYRSKGSSTIALIDADGKLLSSLKVGDTGGKYIDGAFSKFSLKAYYNVLTVAVVEGEVDLYSFQLYVGKDTLGKEINSIGADGLTAIDGKWTSINGNIKSYEMTNRDLQQANAVLDNRYLTDYTASVDVKLDADSFGKAGLLLRVKNIAANTGSVHQIFSNNDQSYFAFLDANGTVGLNKHNYNSVDLASAEYAYTPNKANNLKVEVKGNRICVYVDGKLKIDYTDTANPYLSGKIGLHSDNCTATYSKFKIS